MYFNIDTTPFRSIPSVPALLSVAEMIYLKYPDISSVHVHYATKLIENNLATKGLQPGQDTELNKLKIIASQLPLPPINRPEAFANSLMAAAFGPYAAELNQIAYLTYCALSIYGPLSPNIQSRIANAQRKIQPNPQNAQSSVAYPSFDQLSNNSLNNYPNLSQGQPIDAPPSFNIGESAQGPPAFTPGQSSGGPPAFTPGQSSGGPPAFTPGQSSGGPPAFTPGQSSGGPPAFTPGQPAGGPPAFTPGQSTGGPPAFTPGQSSGGPPAFTPGQSSGGPPAFTPGQSSGGPPAFTPGQSSGGPPAFTPGQSAGGPPAFTPGQSSGSPPAFTPGYPDVSSFYQSSGGPPSFDTPQYNNSTGNASSNSNVKSLAELAQKAFNAGQLSVAFSALKAAIAEGKK